MNSEKKVYMIMFSKFDYAQEDIDFLTRDFMILICKATKTLFSSGTKYENNRFCGTKYENDITPEEHLNGKCYMSLLVTPPEPYSPTKKIRVIVIGKISQSWEMRYPTQRQIDYPRANKTSLFQFILYDI